MRIKEGKRFSLVLCVYFLSVVCIMLINDLSNYSRFRYISLVSILYIIIQEIIIECFEISKSTYRIIYKGCSKIHGLSIKGSDNKYYSYTRYRNNLDDLVKNTSKSFITECNIFYYNGFSKTRKAYVLCNKSKSRKIIIEDKGYVVRVTLPV